MVQNATAFQFEEAPARVNEWRRFSRVFFQRKLVMFGLVIISLLVICAIFAPLLAPYNPYVGNLNRISSPTVPASPPGYGYRRQRYLKPAHLRRKSSHYRGFCYDINSCLCRNLVRSTGRVFRRDYRYDRDENHGYADGIPDAFIGLAY